jgi:hypothetical protein
MTDETNKCRRRQDKMSVRKQRDKKMSISDRETYRQRDLHT